MNGYCQQLSDCFEYSTSDDMNAAAIITSKDPSDMRYDQFGMHLKSRYLYKVYRMI